MRNVSDKIHGENQNAHSMFSVVFFQKSYCLRGGVEKFGVEPDRPQVTIQYSTCSWQAGYLRLQTHTQYVVLTAFPLQQWLHERSSVLCLCIHCLSFPT